MGESINVQPDASTMLISLPAPRRFSCLNPRPLLHNIPPLLHRSASTFEHRSQFVPFCPVGFELESVDLVHERDFEEYVRHRALE